MSKIYHLQDSFSAGQLSKDFLGRVDSVAYKTGLKECVNSIPNSRGPAERRPGFKSLDRRTGIVKSNVFGFEVDDAISFSLMFYGTTLRIKDLSTEGNERLRGNKLGFGTTGWVISGTITQHDDHIEIPPDGYIEQVFEMNGASTIKVDAVFTNSVVSLGTTVGAADVLNAPVTSPEKYYTGTATRTGTTYLRIATDVAATEPTLVYGVSLKDTLVPAADQVLVTTHTPVEDITVEMAPGNLSAYVLHPLVTPYELSYNTSTKVWTWAAITFTATPAEWVAGAYPTTMTFHQGRSWWVGPTPSMFWGSKSGSYKDMTTGALADDAMAYTLADRGVIYWIRSANDLMIGTDTGEFVVSPSNAPITPGNVDVNRQSSYGSAPVLAKKFHEGLVFVAGTSRQIRFMQYTREYLGWGSADATYMNGDIVSTGIVDIDQNKYTDTLVWVLRKDGEIVGYSFSKEVTKGGVYGWFSVLFEGYTTVSFTTIRNHGVSRLYCTEVVKIDGTYETHLVSIDKDDDVYLDDYVEFSSNTATTAVTGLDHLEGETVSVIADHATQADKTVVAGAVTLDTAANHGYVGKKYKTTLTPPGISYKDFKGETSGSRKVLLGKTVIKLYRSAMPLVNGVQNPVRFPDTPMGIPESPKTVDVDARVLGWHMGGYVSITTSEPYPLTVLSITSEAMTEAL